MNRRTAGAALVAAVGIVAIALAAATLTSTATTDTGVGGGLAGAGEGVVGSGEGGFVPFSGSPFGVPLLPLPPFGPLLSLLFALLLLVGILYLLANWQVIPRVVAATLLMLAIVWLARYLPLPALQPIFPEDFVANETGLGDPPGGGFQGDVEPSAPSAFLFLVLAMGVVVGAIVLLRGAARDTDDETPATDLDTDAVTAQAAGVGRAAGRAADRIQGPRSAELENEVYRAWRDMTQHLDVSNPDASTPGEFATAAVDAGMDRSDVRRLTRLFERVRYGGADPADHEETAVEILRRIESNYATEEPPGPGSADDDASRADVDSESGAGP